jgi:hypothetical protein
MHDTRRPTSLGRALPQRPRRGLDRVLSLVGDVRPGERLVTTLMLFNLFVLLVAYY